MDPKTSERTLDSRRTITVVSGLPRSGTSMMMQMCEALGFEAARDDLRPPDDDNPKGYYELDAVRRLPRDGSFLAPIAGRVVKVVSPLLRFLPPAFDYCVIFMERDLDEVLASQRTMLRRIAERVGEVAGPALDDEALGRAFANQLRDAKAWLAAQPNVRTRFVSHAFVLASPAEASAGIAAFLEANAAFGTRVGAMADRERALERMAGVVDARLHRQRGRRPT